MKDSESDVDPELNLLIQRLAVLSDSHMVMDAPASLAASVVDAHIPEMAVVEPEPEPAPEPSVEPAAGCETESEGEEIAEAAEFEEEADACADCGMEPGAGQEVETPEADLPADDAAEDSPAMTEAESQEETVAEVESSSTEATETDSPELSAPESETESAEAAEEAEDREEEADIVVEEAECEERGEEPCPEPEHEPETETETEAVAEAQPVIYEVVETPAVTPRTIFPADLRRAFSLNDIFFYQRTLFGGSAGRFTETLHAAAGMADSGELRRYLSEVQRVNVKSDTAKEFIAVIATFLDD